MEFEIVPMQERHIPAVAALEKQCFSDPWPEQVLSAELKNELSLWLAAEREGTLLGYIGSQTVLGESDMMNLAVTPQARRQGVGRALTEALCDALQKTMQAQCLTLEVRCSNESAIRLYESLGFRQIGRRPGYYFHPKEDALIYRKELNR